MVAYILFDPELMVALRAETSLAYQNGSINLHHLVNNCPRLHAVYFETLRVANGAPSARKIVAPTPMGSKVLRMGNSILIPFRQLHHKKAIFGSTADRFDAQRFLEDKTLMKSPSFKPFGGGVNYCPGRFLAKQEMLVFVALLLNRFDIELTSESLKNGANPMPPRFPKLNESTPALGVNDPVKGSDVYVRLRERTAQILCTLQEMEPLP